MNPVSAIVVFVVIWWVIFLMALPFGSSPPDIIEAGHADSAPDKPHLRKKLLWTTLISFILFLLTIAVVHYSDYTFQDKL